MPFNAGTSARPTDCPSRSRAQGRGDPVGEQLNFAAIGKPVTVLAPIFPQKTPNDFLTCADTAHKHYQS